MLLRPIPTLRGIFLSSHPNVVEFREPLLDEVANSQANVVAVAVLRRKRTLFLSSFSPLVLGRPVTETNVTLPRLGLPLWQFGKLLEQHLALAQQARMAINVPVDAPLLIATNDEWVRRAIRLLVNSGEKPFDFGRRAYITDFSALKPHLDRLAAKQPVR